MLTATHALVRAAAPRRTAPAVEVPRAGVDVEKRRPRAEYRAQFADATKLSGVVSISSPGPVRPRAQRRAARRCRWRTRRRAARRRSRQAPLERVDQRPLSDQRIEQRLATTAMSLCRCSGGRTEGTPRQGAACSAGSSARSPSAVSQSVVRVARVAEALRHGVPPRYGVERQDGHSG